MARSEPDHLGERSHDPYLRGSEVDDYGGIAFDEDDTAKAVLVVGNKIVQFESLDGRTLRRRLEGT